MSRVGFNDVATKPAGKGANHLIDRILLERKELENTQFVVPASGNSAITVMTVDEVFKGPILQGDEAVIQSEYALLQRMSGRALAVKTPQPKGLAEDGSFYAMERIRATALTPARLSQLPVDERDRLAQAAGLFLAQMAACGEQDDEFCTHAVTQESMQEVFGARAFWSKAGDVTVMRRLKTYLEAHPLPPLMLLHDDVHAQNVLYDDETKDICIIDLGAGQKIPPQQAFINIRTTYGEDFCKQALAAFGQQSGVNLGLNDLDLYVRIQGLAGIVKYGSTPEQLWTYAKDGINEVLDSLNAPPAPANRLLGGLLRLGTRSP